MTKLFSEKSAYELEQEMHRYFDGSIDQTAINYWRTTAEYLKELERKRTALTGIYAVKSQYHSRKLNLPFIIEYYSETEKAYKVSSVEYRGWGRYKADAYYTEKTIDNYINTGLIQQIASFDNLTKNSKEVNRLISLYRNAKEPLN